MYDKEKYFSKICGNNAIAHTSREALWSSGKLYIPKLITWSIEDVSLGDHIVLEETQGDILVSCKGLRYFVHTEYQGVPTYIVDNHNHVLTFRHKHIWATVIHIDQHSDTKPNEYILWDNDDIEIFVHGKTNVGNFITAAINSWIINKVIQVRTDYTLHNIQNILSPTQNYILDIDIDFRSEKNISNNDIQIIRSLMQQAQLITIATSPYFIDQQKAIAIIKRIRYDEV